MNKAPRPPAAPLRAAQAASHPAAIVCAALVLALLTLARQIAGAW
jgi:hypothetical protein